MTDCTHARLQLLSGLYGDYVECLGCGSRSKANAQGDPMYPLADYETRRLRIDTYYYFDQLWRGAAFTRTKAYAWLATELELRSEQCHIRMFDVTTCQRAIALCKERLAGR